MAPGGRAPAGKRGPASRARPQTPGTQPRPPGPQHHTTPRTGPVRLRPRTPPLSALRHLDPGGRPGRRLPRAPDVLVPGLPERPGTGQLTKAPAADAEPAPRETDHETPATSVP